jgi:D-sedoheptulose 7-phosphate isomerase
LTDRATRTGSAAFNGEQEDMAAFSIGDDVGGTLAALARVLTPDFLATVDPVARALEGVLAGGGKLLIMGNGGSAADAQHIAAELVGRFKRERRALPAIALSTDSSILTAWSNDYAFDTVFSRQVEALARPGDMVWGISTSGNSANVVRAFEAARAMGVATLGLLGRDGGRLRALSDHAIVVPLAETDRIQAAHLLLYHALCAHLDEAFAPHA